MALSTAYCRTSLSSAASFWLASRSTLRAPHSTSVGWYLVLEFEAIGYGRRAKVEEQCRCTGSTMPYVSTGQGVAGA
eukprot:3940644-Rhodomonas_salina.3